MNEHWTHIDKSSDVKNGLMALKGFYEKFARHGIEVNGATIAGEDRSGWWIRYEVVKRRLNESKTD
jgi:hypothetical protein